jgi:hypothetical protein
MKEIEYFLTTGEINSEKTLEIAHKRLQENDIHTVIIASSYGDTGLAVVNKLKDMPINVIVISIDRHWDGIMRLSPDIKMKIESSGNTVYKGAMPFEYHRFTKEPGVKLIADTLRRFGEGMKVCVEIILMAVSGELVADGEKVLAIAGTHRGADTAIVATAAPIYYFNRFEINEILCKPYNIHKKE